MGRRSSKHLLEFGSDILTKLVCAYPCKVRKWDCDCMAFNYTTYATRLLPLIPAKKPLQARAVQPTESGKLHWLMCPYISIKSNWHVAKFPTPMNHPAISPSGSSGRMRDSDVRSTRARRNFWFPLRYRVMVQSVQIPWIIDYWLSMLDSLAKETSRLNACLSDAKLR
jgi:hypothetical protein